MELHEPRGDGQGKATANREKCIPAIGREECLAETLRSLRPVCLDTTIVYSHSGGTRLSRTSRLLHSFGITAGIDFEPRQQSDAARG